MKKLTQKEADRLDRDVGAIPIGQYINSKTKREYQCVTCGCSYFACSKVVRQYKQLTCVKCSYQIRSDKRKLTQEYVEKEFQKRQLVLNDRYVDCDTKVKTVCKCKNVFYTSPHSVLQNDTKSCGHCNDLCVGDKFDKLIIIAIKPNNVGGGGCKVKCKCDCGNETRWIKNSLIKNENIKTCGNCKRYKNGNLTSYIALRLHNIIEQITGRKWEHNHHIKGVGYVDIASPELKIAIEYDGYYWHRVYQDRTQRDKEKYSKLIKSGWKLLNIKSSGDDIPSEKHLRKIILNEFQHGSNKKTITMKSWTKSEHKYSIKKGE